MIQNGSFLAEKLGELNMKQFTYKDYRKALKGVGPKTAKNIIDRAILEGNCSWNEIKKLCDYAYGSF